MKWLATFGRILRLGVKSLFLHKLRSALTTLGILFGVSSVIAMLAIGEGASYEAQQRIARLGATNIIIRAVKPPEDNSAGATRSRVLEYGLTYMDAERLATTIPAVDIVVPVRSIRKDIRSAFRRTEVDILGTVPWFPDVSGIRLKEGRFVTSLDIYNSTNVCILSGELARDLFPLEEAMGKTVKAGTLPFQVVGVLEERGSTDDDEDQSALMYIPLTTAKSWFGEVISKRTSGSMDMEQVELHRLVARVPNTEDVIPTADAIREMMSRFHKKMDYKVDVPLELLRDAEETKRMFNIVLGSIAGISLLVGGIGIMNVMLASVTERTREIGIRRALGAKKHHIISQFLVETIVLSASGGLLGVALGAAIPIMVSYYTDMITIVTPFSLVLAFTISALVGVVFGLYPAARAANMDPVEALRHD